MNEERRKQNDDHSKGKNDLNRTDVTPNDAANHNYLGSTIANVCIILGVLAFGFTVSYVLKAAGTQQR